MNELTYILLPGMIGTADLFSPLLAVMPENIRRKVIGYPTDTFLNYDSILNFVEDRLVEEMKIVVIGESYSGALALLLASSLPDRVVGVVLSGGYISPPWPGFLRFLIRPILLKIRIPSWIIRFFAAGKDASEDFVTQVRNALAVPLPQVMVSRAREALMMDNTQALLRCAVPILYLAPEQDRLVPSRNLKRILKVRPDVKVYRLAGPHLILQTAPGEAWKAIDGFVAGVR